VRGIVKEIGGNWSATPPRPRRAAQRARARPPRCAHVIDPRVRVAL